MAQSNHERVGKALELLNTGLWSFVERELRAVHGDRWIEMAEAGLREGRAPARRKNEAPHWDTQALLTVMWDQWNAVFKKTLGPAERTLVSELRDVRNKWAHQEQFSSDDAYRTFDSIARLLAAVSAPEASEVERQKQELLRLRFEEQTRRETRKASVAAIAGQPTAGLKPWREVVTPHPDVASGRYQQAEFAADLAQVHRSEGADEYLKPRDFFMRTFITDGLRHLLRGAVERLNGSGGDPVVELQTNFGGGKTHSMLALYHLFSGVPMSELPGVEAVLEGTGVSQPPKARRAILVGSALSPAQPRTKPDGTVVRTLWGELAWQLLEKKGFALVAEADKAGVSPGSDLLRDLFARAAPSLILIDEWVAYVRQLYSTSQLPAGSFDANISFAQALTEAAKAVPRTLVVATLPTSDIEIGGEGGREALAQLSNTFARVQSPWRPASADESFEIVRRRLFEPIRNPALFVARDAVVRAFADMYRDNAQEFPGECREAAYERRLSAAYPIHPELFDRLYDDWSSLEKFQRTRGVLRLMAAVIHTLWERQDGGLLILPASVSIDAGPVQFELTRYLEDNWVPVIEKDVDGPHSLPLTIDRENPNLGRYSACRRVARTIYLGSAPTLHAAHKGLDDRHIKLGCVQPGEGIGTFGDALRRLSDAGTHVYADKQRYWYSTQPSVLRLAEDRAGQYDADTVAEEIRRHLRSEQGVRGDFVRVHPCPESPGDVADEREAKLVIIGPDHPHVGKDGNSAARRFGASVLESRGASPRRYRNALVFLAADRTRLAELESAVRTYLAWKSIEDDRVSLNLDAFQSNQAKEKRERANETVRSRIPETYQWLLVPTQGTPTGEVEWQEIRLQGQDPLAVRASKKLRNDELLLTQLGPIRLRMELDGIPLWRGDHVGVKQLSEDFAQYLYLPRLRDSDVLIEAVQEGPSLTTWSTETFAYAEGWDEARGRYRGLQGGQRVRVILDADSVVVKPEAAIRQLDAERSQRPETDKEGETGPGESKVPPEPKEEGRRAPRRFHGSVSLDPTRLGRDAGKIAEEVAQHLAGLVNAKLEVTLEISADIPDGVPENIVRTITENCRTLKFKTHGFEES